VVIQTGDQFIWDVTPALADESPAGYRLARFLRRRRQNHRLWRTGWERA
jgi:hypothetical protein